MLEYLLEELKIKYFKDWKIFSSYKNKSVFLTEDINQVDLKHNKKNKSVIFIVGLENIHQCEIVKDWEMYSFETINEGPKINYNITICEENSYDIFSINEYSNIINSIYLMFPFLYKMIVRIILLGEENNLIYCDDELKNVVKTILEKVNMKIEFYCPNKKNLHKYENIHFVNLPDIEIFYKILNNYTISNVCFKSYINFWFYIGKNELERYENFETIINEKMCTFSKLLNDSKRVKCDFDGNIVVNF